MLIYSNKLVCLGKTFCLLLNQSGFGKEKQKKNIKLFKHPNNNSFKEIYVIPIVYIDNADSFHSSSLRWKFHKNDKRKIKRIKKRK